MSYGDASQNPDAAPAAFSSTANATSPQGPWPTQIEYFRAYRYIFDHPQWLTTVGWLGVLSLVNLIPPLNVVYLLLLFGYGFTVLDSLLASGGSQYPTFEMGRFQDYLTRGLWPFLVHLIGSVILAFVFYLGLFPLALLGAGVAVIFGERAAGPIVALLALPALVGLLVVAVAGSFALWGMVLRSGLARDFASGFDHRWVADFMSTMWREQLLSALFLLLTVFVLDIVGLLALCVGILFVGPIVALAIVHLTYQLYAVYLSRGGTPVPIVQR